MKMSVTVGDPSISMTFSKEEVYFQENKKTEGQGKEKCHVKSMMSHEANERLKKRETQHVPLRKNAEEKVRGMGLKAVWDDANE